MNDDSPPAATSPGTPARIDAMLDALPDAYAKWEKSNDPVAEERISRRILDLLKSQSKA